MNASKIAQYVTQEDNGYTLHIPVSEQFAGVAVTGIAMFVSNEADEEGWYYDGDLAVLWDAEGLENTGGGDMGTLIMRGWDDAVGEVMGEFYWQHGFDARLRELLAIAGFSKEACEAVSGSEWGMQDEERASYDAGDIAAEVRAAMETVAA